MKLILTLPLTIAAIQVRGLGPFEKILKFRKISSQNHMKLGQKLQNWIIFCQFSSIFKILIIYSIGRVVSLGPFGPNILPWNTLRITFGFN